LPRAVVLGALLISGETLVLKEKAAVPGRWVRLLDLLDLGRTSEAARLQAAGVYLGAAPEEGRTRTILAEEVARELERRGVDPGFLTIAGEKVEVARGASADDPLRRAIAFEIKRHLLERQAVPRADELAVRVDHLDPEALPEGYEVEEIRARGGDFTAVLVDPGRTRRVEAAVVARILRRREVAFAAREIPAGKVLERADLEAKRLETTGGEDYLPGDLSPLVGASAAARIRKGQPLSAGDLRLRPSIRRGDVVRAVSSGFEVDARALEDGAPGQEILLEYAASKRRLRARVADAGRVEVAEVGR
jgi:flagella basal body P-ring formation protein FlgA